MAAFACRNSIPAQSTRLCLLVLLGGRLTSLHQRHPHRRWFSGYSHDLAEYVVEMEEMRLRRPLDSVRDEGRGFQRRVDFCFIFYFYFFWWGGARSESGNHRGTSRNGAYWVARRCSSSANPTGPPRASPPRDAVVAGREGRTTALPLVLSGTASCPSRLRLRRSLRGCTDTVREAQAVRGWLPACELLTDLRRKQEQVQLESGEGFFAPSPCAVSEQMTNRRSKHQYENRSLGTKRPPSVVPSSEGTSPNFSIFSKS